jgi:hypothetical protein
MTRLVSNKCIVLALLVCGLFTLPGFADSQVRIVRLSDIDGDVQIDHGTGYEKALRNSPITQGVRLWTKDSALAEVEFENGTTMRLAPGTILEFPDLSLRDSGAKVSVVELKQGIAYFNINKQKDDEFRVSLGQEQATFRKSARVRMALNDGKADVAVTKGDLQLEGPSGEVKVAKDQTLKLDVGANTYEIAKGVDADQYDNWNKQESDYQTQYSRTGGSFPYAYGVSDLNYYGNYFFLPGYGYVWQPSFANANWDPFSNGSWVWYPRFGYTWVSDYQWGWMPYRYGNWIFANGWGWCWQPGGFTGWNTTPIITSAPSGFVPPRPPTVAANHPTFPVNRNPGGVGTPSVGRGTLGRAPAGEASIHGHAPVARGSSPGQLSGQGGKGAAIASPGGHASPGPRVRRMPSIPRAGTALSTGGFGTMGSHGSPAGGTHAGSGTHSTSPHR